MSGEMNGCDSQQFETDVGRMGEKEVTKQSSHLYHKTLVIESHIPIILIFCFASVIYLAPFHSLYPYSPLEFTRSLLVRCHTHHFFISFCRSVLSYSAIVLHYTCIHDLPFSGYVSPPYLVVHARKIGIIS